jgi:hypothetical protein
VEESTVARTLAEPDGVPRRLVDPLVGDRGAQAMAAIERLTGGRRIVPAEGERVETRLVPERRLELDEDATAFVADRVNADRLEAGAEPLARSDALWRMAAERAMHMYAGGFVARRPNAAVLEATAVTGLRLQVAAEMVALASSTRAAQAAVAEAEDTALADARFDRFGVAVVEGPLGVLVVEVYGR